MVRSIGLVVGLSMLVTGCSSQERVVSTWSLGEGRSHLEIHEAEVEGGQAKMTSAPILAQDPELADARVLSLGFMHHDLRDEHLVCLRGSGVQRVDVWPGGDDQSWVLSWQTGESSYAVDVAFGEDAIVVHGTGKPFYQPLVPGFWTAPANKVVLLLREDGQVDRPQLLSGTLRTPQGKNIPYQSKLAAPDAEQPHFLYSWEPAAKGRSHEAWKVRPARLF